MTTRRAPAALNEASDNGTQGISSLLAAAVTVSVHELCDVVVVHAAPCTVHLCVDLTMRTILPVDINSLLICMCYELDYASVVALRCTPRQYCGVVATAVYLDVL